MAAKNKNAARPDEPERVRPPSAAEQALEVENVAVQTNADHDPADGDENDERVVLVRTGLIRVRLGGQQFRLRRPLFGEFRTLRTAMQDANDEITEATDDVLAVGKRLTDEEKDANPDTLDPDEWIAHRRETRKQSQAATRGLADLQEDLRLKWWEQMWDLLALDGRPPDWPPWVVDSRLHATIVSHWRESPLGRG